MYFESSSFMHLLSCECHSVMRVTFFISFKVQQYSLTWTILESTCLSVSLIVNVFVYLSDLLFVCLFHLQLFLLLRSYMYSLSLLYSLSIVVPTDLSWPWWGTGSDRGAASWSRPGYKRPGRTTTQRETLSLIVRFLAAISVSLFDKLQWIFVISKSRKVAWMFGRHYPWMTKRGISLFWSIELTNIHHCVCR